MSQQLMLELQNAIHAVLARHLTHGQTIVKNVTISSDPNSPMEREFKIDGKVYYNYMGGVKSSVHPVRDTNLDTAQGDDLDWIAEAYGVTRGYDRHTTSKPETDADLRNRILDRRKGQIGCTPTTSIMHGIDHSGHDVVENTAGGKSFKYCRQCKTEVT